MKLRQTATVDRDSVNPGSIIAATEYVIEALDEKTQDPATPSGTELVINWNTLHVYTRVNRKTRDLTVIAWVKTF